MPESWFLIPEMAGLVTLLDGDLDERIGGGVQAPVVLVKVVAVEEVVIAVVDGELTVKILADSNNNQPFKMRENKRTGLFQSLEARFDDHIISIAYEKNHLFPGEKMEKFLNQYNKSKNISFNKVTIRNFIKEFFQVYAG